MIVKILKKLNLYSTVKRYKDTLVFNKQFKKEHSKLIDLYLPFISEGNLVFDCGSAYGNRSKIFMELGAKKVIAVEPLTYYNQFLNKIKGVTVENKGLGSKEETKTFYECSSPTLSTFDKEQVDILKANPQMSNIEWFEPKEFQITTLDKLIEEHGFPDFIKLDIEEYELEALKGLSLPVKAIGFEFHTYNLDKTIKCLNLLCNKLNGVFNDYVFNFSLRESFKLELEEYVPKDELIKHLKNIPLEVEFGDIYARRLL